MHFLPSSTHAISRVVGVAALTFAAFTANAAVAVSSASNSPTFIGTIVAGQEYVVTVSGIANLYASFDGGKGLTFTADGKPTYDFSAPYIGFNPNGSDYDVSASSNAFGIGGPGRLLGALLGTYVAAPSGSSDYFVIGLGTSFTAAADGSLYAAINDTYYADNAASGYSVTLAAVPEPETAALVLAGLASVGVVTRRRKAS